MKRVGFRYILMLTFLLAACASNPPASAPVAAPAVDSGPAPAADSGPAPATAGETTSAPAAPTPSDGAAAKTPAASEQLATICKLQKDTHQQIERLRAHVADLLKDVGATGVKERIEQEPGTCLHGVKGPVPDLFLIQGDSRAYWPTVIAWRAGDRWQVASVDRQYLDAVEIGTGTMVDGRPNLILVDMSSGTSGAKLLDSFTVDAAGKGVLRQVSGIYSKSGFAFLRPDLVLVTHRAELWDRFSNSCNGCVPSREQELLQWTGEVFKPVASRLFSEPELTLNLLQDALQRKDQKRAAELVAAPELVPAAQAVLAGQPAPYHRFGPDISAYAAAESHNWDQLPAEARTALPPRLQVYFASIQTAQGTVHLRLDRGPSGWVLSGISSPGASQPVSFETASAAVQKLDQVQAAALPGALGDAVPPLLGYLDRPGEDLTAGTRPGKPYLPGLPGVGLSPAPGGVRLVYLSNRVRDLVGGAWTWLQWQDGTVIRDQLLRQAEDWEPLQVVRVGTTPSVTLAVLWQSASTPHDQEVAVYQLDGQTWAKPYVFTNAWDFRDKAPVPFEPGGDHLTLRGSTGGIISVTPDGQTIKVCAKGLDPCLNFRWTGTAYIAAAK